MKECSFQLKNAPIVEAVLDLDCDLPPGQSVAELEGRAREAFLEEYPQVRTRVRADFMFQASDGKAEARTGPRQLDALLFTANDGKQIVQVRTDGYSFNRLAPYESLDSYLPEIERTWKLFVSVANPILARAIRLRYINRILIPVKQLPFKLGEFINIGPILTVDESLVLTKFVVQQSAVDTTSKNQVKITVADQPMQGAVLPVVLDIEVAGGLGNAPDDWASIREKLSLLRSLKNRVFRDALTPECIKLFQT